MHQNPLAEELTVSMSMLRADSMRDIRVWKPDVRALLTDIQMSVGFPVDITQQRRKGAT